MKIAYCMRGISKDFEYSFDNIQENMINDIRKHGHQVYIFLDTYNFDKLDLLISKYSPVKILLNNENIRNELNIIEIIPKQCIEIVDLVKSYEIENNMNFDIVISTRFDISFTHKFSEYNIDFEKINMECMFIPDYNSGDCFFLVPRRYLDSYKLSLADIIFDKSNSHRAWTYFEKYKLPCHYIGGETAKRAQDYDTMFRVTRYNRYEKFNYIIAAYFGKRRSYNLETTEIFLDIHLDFFNKNYIELLNRIIVVFNISNNDDFNKIEILKNKYRHLPITFILKDNIGGSYYNFELGLFNSLLDIDVKYCFTVEDDYVPDYKYFYEPFFNKINERNKTIFVCQSIEYWDGKPYAGVSNGFFDLEKIRNYYYKHNRLFKLEIQNNIDYNIFSKNQIDFTDYIREEYYLESLKIDYCHPWYGGESQVSNKPILTYFGNVKGDIVLRPIIFNSYFYRKLIYDDLDFLLSVRNECLDFLHNNYKYTIEETKKWFKETNTLFYIINYNNTDIGYFKLSNYSKENKTVYIECNLYKEFRCKKLAYNAYINFIDFITLKLEIKIFYSEILESNKTAYNLYKKLGFNEDREIKIYRNEKTILMSANKDYFFNYNNNLDFSVRVSGDKIYILSNSNMSVIVSMCDIYNNVLYVVNTNFNFNEFWYSIGQRMIELGQIKIKISDVHNNLVYQKIVDVNL